MKAQALLELAHAVENQGQGENPVLNRAATELRSLHDANGVLVKALVQAIKYFDDNGAEADFTWLPELKKALRLGRRNS